MRVLGAVGVVLMCGVAASAELATIGIGNFKNKAGVDPEVAAVLADMITTRLTQSNKFNVLERTQLGDLFDEQSLGASGAVDPASAASIGRLKGADYLLIGVVTEAGTSRRDTVHPAGKISTVSAALAIDIRFTDSTTGTTEVADTYRVSRSQTAVASHRGGFSLTYGIGQDMGREAVDKICRQIFDRVLPPKVAMVEGAKVYLNYGDVYFAPGETYEVQAKGKAIVDPDTGKVIGYSDGPGGGKVRISSVNANTAEGEIIDGTAAVGDKLVRVSAAPSKTVKREKPNPFR